MGKENVHPNVLPAFEADLLSKAGSAAKPSTNRCDAAQQQRAAFEAKLRRAGCQLEAVGEQEDIVQVWCDYIRWQADQDTQQKGACPDGECSDEAALLSRACSALAADAQHVDDVRHLRLWVRHASNSKQPKRIFEYLAEQGIGLGHALLYEAWATSLERQRHYEQAEAVYQRGIQASAEPMERLRDRAAEFEDRMRRRAVRGRPAHQAANAPSDAGEPPADQSGEVDRRRHQPEAPAGKKCGSIPPRAAEAQESSASLQVQAHDDVSFEELRAERVLNELVTGRNPPAEWASALQEAADAVKSPMPPLAVQLAVCELQPEVVGEPIVTEELSTSGVRALLARAERRRRSSLASSASRVSASTSVFEDPTATMELAQREVLDILANDPDHAPKACEASGFLGGSGRVGGLGGGLSVDVEQHPAWEVFDEF